MRKLTLFYFLLLSSTSFCQNFADIYTGGYETIDYVKKDLNKKIEKAKNTRTINGVIESTINDTLIYVVQDAYDGFTLKMTFNIKQEYYNENFCDFQQIEFDCTPCSNKHFEEIIKQHKFRRKSENVYLSSFLSQTEMTVQYKSEKKECLILTFKYVDLPRKKYKEQYRKLKKKRPHNST